MLFRSPQTDVVDVEPREAGKQLIRVEGKNFSPFGALHGETDGSDLGVRRSAQNEISILMAPDICVGTEAVFDVAEELSAEEAHPDIDAAPELGADRRGGQSGRAEPVRWIALDNLDLAPEAHFLEKRGDETADDGAADDDDLLFGP